MQYQRQSNGTSIRGKKWGKGEPHILIQGGPTQRDVTISTSEIEITKHTSSELYQIEATNSAVSSWTEIEIKVIGICLFVCLDICFKTLDRYVE